MISVAESKIMEENQDSGPRPDELLVPPIFRVNLNNGNQFLYKGKVYRRVAYQLEENQENITLSEMSRKEEVVTNDTGSSEVNEGGATLVKDFNSNDLCLFCLIPLPPSDPSHKVTHPANPGTSLKDPASNSKAFDLLCAKLGLKWGDNESIQEEETERFDKNKDLPLCSGCKNDYEDFSRLNQKMMEMEAHMNDCVNTVQSRIECVKIIRAKIEDEASKDEKVSAQVEQPEQLLFEKRIIESGHNIFEVPGTSASISVGSSQIMQLEPNFLEEFSDGVNEIDLRRGSFYSAWEAALAEDTPTDPSIGENVDLGTCSPLEQNSKADSYEIKLEAGSDDDGLSTDSDAGCETWEDILENSRRRTKWLLEMSRQGKLQKHFAKVRQKREVRKQPILALKRQRNTGSRENAKPQTSGSTRKPNVSKHKRKCHLCDLKLGDVSDLIRHYKEFHPEEKRFTCKYCGKHFKDNQAILSHQRIHTGERPFKCQDCGRYFSRERSFQGHMKTHTEDVHVCKWCGKTFRFLISFDEHNRKNHDGSAECTDRISDLSEKNLKSLGVTAKIHYRFNCHVCMEPITSQAFLPRHFAKMHPNHSGGHLTCCCGRKFINYGDVSKHIKLGQCVYHG